MPPPVHTDSDSEGLMALYRRLDTADRATLTAFAEFLASRTRASSPTPPQRPEAPRTHPRPPEESVVAAIRRLSDSYFMLERDTLLHDTAALMNAHVLQGRPAPAVIDDLEALFAERYARYRARFGD